MAFDWVGPDLVFGGLTTLLVITGILSLRDAAAGVLAGDHPASLQGLTALSLSEARILHRSCTDDRTSSACTSHAQFVHSLQQHTLLHPAAAVLHTTAQGSATRVC
jgi:hypothetical protein